LAARARGEEPPRSDESYRTEWLQAWHDIFDPEARPFEDENDLVGRLQDHRYDRAKLWQCLAIFRKGERMYECLVEVIEATGGVTWAGVYLAIAQPYPATDRELVDWVGRLLVRSRELVGVIGRTSMPNRAAAAAIAPA
jgi:hypothetical protein